MFKTKSFIPYLLVAFFNAFIDLGHKILIQNTLYQTTTAAHYTMYSSILNALILLPYILIFTPSGFISDKFSKARILQITATLTFPILLFVTFCYYHGWFWTAYGMTLLLGFQSALNSPAKYGYIKEIFGKANIAQANAYVQTVTIVAILAGTFVFTLLFTHMVGHTSAATQLTPHETLYKFAPLGFLLCLLSVLEITCTLFLVKKKAADPNSHYNPALYFRGHYLKQYLSKITHNQIILICILGLALFWGVNQVLLASYGAYLKSYVANASALYAQGSLAVGGIGILIGALYAGRLSKGYIETGAIPVAAIGLTLGLLLLAHLTNKIAIVALFLVYGFFGGMLVVPLNALIQFNSKPRDLGKVLAGNNFIQNIAMFSFLALSTLGAIAGLSSKADIHMLFLLFLVASISALFLLPQSLIRYLLYFMMSKFYRVDVHGINNLPSTGGVLLLGNHVSYLDWAIVQIASPRPVRFVMDRGIYEKWYLKWILQHLNMIPISRGASKEALKTVTEALNNGEVIAIFPEGALSRNGQLGKFHTGFERAAADTKAKIVPFFIRGLWGSASSYATPYYKKLSRVKQRRISFTFGKSLPADASAAEVKQAVTKLSVKAWRDYAHELKSIPMEWLDRATRMGNATAVTDSVTGKLSHNQLIALVFQLRNKLRKTLFSQKNVGILLPASAGGIATNLALLCLGKVVVNLNYTTSTDNLNYALNAAHIKTIITSRQFTTKLSAKGFDLDPIHQHAQLIYLEDLVENLNKLQMLLTMVVMRIFPIQMTSPFYVTRQSPHDTAAILFSSGSEGNPKGVMLSHQNILSNVKQIANIFNIEEDDRILSCLPMFHAFGLTATSLMPVIEGIPVVCHPDPTDARQIGRLVYKNRITVICSTSSILGIYIRSPKLLPEMFHSVRFVIAGAEKLAAHVYEDFKKKFNINIYEGYGATELSPVASSNIPDVLSATDWHMQKGTELGTVGLPLPGTAFKIVDPESLKELPLGEAGLILVSGPQLMQGYLDNVAKTRDVTCKIDGIRWYKTGDKGFLDEDGFLTIVDRYSRFAKIGGEMISLGAVEEHILAILDLGEVDVMAIAAEDPKKGEKIILLYDFEMDPKMIKKQLIDAGLSPQMIPSEYQQLPELPRLGSGKKDYNAAKLAILK